MKLFILLGGASNSEHKTVLRHMNFEVSFAYTVGHTIISEHQVLIIAATINPDQRTTGSTTFLLLLAVGKRLL